MEKFTIRLATFEDLETLLHFEQEVINAERPFDPTLRQQDVRYYDLPALLTNENTRLVVAEIDQHLIACGYARIEKSKPYMQHSHHAYLGFMYVLPEQRGKGINKRIIEALTEWCHAKGITELRLEVYAGNEAAIKAYEKAGFQPLMLQMRWETRP